MNRYACSETHANTRDASYVFRMSSDSNTARAPLATLPSARTNCTDRANAAFEICGYRSPTS